MAKPELALSAASQTQALARRPRPPIPSEHGGWVMLLVPLAVGIGVAALQQAVPGAVGSQGAGGAVGGGEAAGFSWGGAALGFVLALSVYLVREPLQQLVKGRRYLSDSERKRLMVWAAGFGAAAAASGAWLFAGMGRWALAGFAVAGAAILAVQLRYVARRRHREARAQVVGVAGLSLSAPLGYLAAAGRLDLAAPWAVGALSLLFFEAGTLYVRMRIQQMTEFQAAQARLKKAGRSAFAGRAASTNARRTALMACALAVAAPLVAAGAGLAPPSAAWAAAPAVLRLMQALRALPGPVSLKRVGLLETAWGLWFGASLVAAYAG